MHARQSSYPPKYPHDASTANTKKNSDSSDDAGTLSWAKWTSGMDSARNLARNCYPIRLKWTQSTLVYEHSPTKRP